ncbi:FMN-dependent NADH-azoreductase [Vogesella fluminis]|uniref:FMN dependent NADH:quinone oxidoreductase n=1 Tax=Vogesella fluminis TaxID=1069161 RepID=A0ABQ3HDG0_9NEIS|nr:FMN-dependent NADH-azoreductase [Vogesella fluminis]GHD76593.1 FMN-dependent NADH-azoreductase [Vogesella fluminis]
MKILHLDSSVLNDNSITRQLTRALVDGLQAQHGSTSVIYHDLASNEIPHLSGEILGAAFTPESDWSELQRSERARSEQLIGEFLGSEILVIGAPMYNFSIPSQLKAWIDRVAVAGRTFKYTETGPVGLAGGKTVYVVSARGGVYSNEQGQAMDFQEDYLKTALGFLGISDVRFIRAEAVNMGDDARSNALSAAKEAITQTTSYATIHSAPC